MTVAWTQVVAMEVVTSGYILKVKLTGSADGLDVECERKVSGLNNWMDGGAIKPDGEVCSRPSLQQELGQGY